ncbi:hypothetical protein GGH96_001190 [Coemansia sp. RSA 1972]|nr:hypothetical protein GGH96_001190 [Coemansia sp. RSA 1972]
MHPERHLMAFVTLNKCLVAAKYQCIQALPLQHSWIHRHVPLDTVILAQQILKEKYSPGTDEEYWAKVIDLKLRVFKDHPRHTFNKFITTDSVSLCVVHRSVEAMLAKKAAGEKRKRNQLAKQAQQTAQQAAQSVQLMQSLQSMVQSFPLSAHSFPLLAQSVQLTQSFPPPVHSFPLLAWVPMVVPAQQAWVPMVTPTQQEWTLTDPPAQPLGQPVQPLGQPVQPVKPVKQQRKKANCLYINELPQEYLRSTARCCVLVDPGWRDLLFAMHEDSTIQKKQIYRYTKCQQRVETKQVKYCKILEQVKKADDEDIAALECTLSAGSFIKPDLNLYKVYLAARVEVATKLTVFYNKTMSWQRDGATTFEVPLHQKLRFSVYIKRQQADDRLVKKLRAKFKPKKTDPEPIFIMGNWSAPMTKFHEPIQGKGWRRLLKHAGYEVYLIDEYLTSKLCPNCNERLSNTHDVPNPRPWRRRIQPKVKCHGLLSCESKACVEFQGKYLREKRSDVKRRLWNRDLVGPAEASTAPKPTKARKTTASTASKPTKACKTTARKPRKTTARKPRKTTASIANST